MEAACIAEAGMDPMRWLSSTDQKEVIAMSAILKAVARMREEANKQS